MAADRVEKGTKEYDALMKQRKEKEIASEAEMQRKLKTLRAQNAKKSQEYKESQARIPKAEREKIASDNEIRDEDFRRQQKEKERQELKNALSDKGENDSIEKMKLRNAYRKRLKEGTSKYFSGKKD